MKLTINTQQRLLLLVVAGIIAVAEAYRVVRGEGGLASFAVSGLVTGLAFFALRAPRQVAPGASHAGVQGTTASDPALVEKYHVIIVHMGNLLYTGLLGRLAWADSPEGKSNASHQIFRESCTILSYYLVCLSLSGQSTLALLRRIQQELKLRTTLSIMGIGGETCPEGAEELSPACRALSAHNLSLIDSFSHLYLRTVENFRGAHPYPLNDLIGGILMLFEGQVPPEPDYWENKYGDVVYGVLDEIASLRRSQNPATPAA
jgi:hypothetical protein